MSKNNKTFIICAHWLGGWSFLDVTDKFAWFFTAPVKAYKRQAMAERKARKCFSKYGFDKIAVFDVSDLSEFSVSDIRDWEDRSVLELNREAA